jgi:asparagine synthase (glutamine-hydrolysing)
LTLCHFPSGIKTLDESPQPFTNEEGSIVVVFEGKIYNLQEIKQHLDSTYDFQTTKTGEALIPLYEKYGDCFPTKLNGKFVFALWDANAEKLLLGRDHLGIEPLYYKDNSNFFCFGNSLKGMLEVGLINKDLNINALMQYLLYCYNPSNETFLKSVYKIPAGHTLCQNGSARSLKCYWHLSFAEQKLQSEDHYREEVLHLIEDAIRIRLEPSEMPGILLSGGTDSTFSFRCMGKSFDESSFARLVAERYGTEHNEIIYGADRVSLISDAVKYMDEPFCDVGIEIGTYLLGMAAEGKVSYTLSGEGGDELFGGHPVYVADKLAKVVDSLPTPIVSPIAALFKKIPDSDQKKNLQVKLKRFAYGLSFPRGLLSHRWRIYYTPNELHQFFNPDLQEWCQTDKLFEPMLKHNKGADGRDILSHSLYNDYFTLVDFYLRRLGLLKAFSIEDRLPLLDVRLVEYAAKIPSSLKIKGLSDTKYIYRRILEGVLPHEILHDRPKLGHSVPIKNWIRDNSELQNLVAEVLSDESIKKRGLVRPDAVRNLIAEHANRRENHSHRIWALVVLELWLRTWIDR